MQDATVSTDECLCTSCGDLCVPVRLFAVPVCMECRDAFGRLERCVDEPFDPKLHARVGLGVYTRSTLTPPSARKDYTRNLALLAVLYQMQVDAGEAIEHMEAAVERLELGAQYRPMRKEEEHQPARAWDFTPRHMPVYGCTGAWWLHKGLRLRERD